MTYNALLRAIVAEMHERHPDCTLLADKDFLGELSLPGLLLRQLTVGRARYRYPVLAFHQDTNGGVARFLAGKCRRLDLADPAIEFPLDDLKNYQQRIVARPQEVTYAVQAYEHGALHPTCFQNYTSGGRRTEALMRAGHYSFPLVQYRAAAAIRVAGISRGLDKPGRLDPERVYGIHSQIKGWFEHANLGFGSPGVYHPVLHCWGTVLMHPSPDAPIRRPFRPTRKLFLYRRQFYYGLTYSDLFGCSVRDSPLSQELRRDGLIWEVHPLTRMRRDDQEQVKAVLSQHFTMD